MLNFASHVQRLARKMYLNKVRRKDNTFITMNTKTIAKAAFVAALAVFALVSCNKNRHRPGPETPDEPVVPEEKVTEGLSVKATYFGDYYGKGFQDYILLFQLGELNEEGAFKANGVELSLDVLTATGGPTLFPAGIYEITDDKFNSAGIIPSIKTGEGDDVTYGDTYLYTQQDEENFWLEPLESARLEVAVEGAQYTIKVLITVDGEEYKYYYKGALPIEDKSKSTTDPVVEGPEGDYDFKADGAVAFNLGHEWSEDTDDWMIYLVNDKDESEWIVVELVSESGNPEALPVGTFNVPADFYNETYEIAAGIMCPLYLYDESYYGTYYVFGDEIWYSASSGNVKITKNGDNNYTVALSFLDEEYDNSKVTSTYTGVVAVDVSEYYDGALTTTRLRKVAPSFKKSVVKRADKQRQTKAASRFACRLS